MKIIKRTLLATLVMFSLMRGITWAETISDYTFYPPFLPRVTSPNILFVLDYSENMVRPAYGTCTEIKDLPETTDKNSWISNCTTDPSLTSNTFSHITDDYSSTTSYEGYFDNKYSGSGSYTDADASTYYCDAGASCKKATTSPGSGWTGPWNANWLNWLTMTQFDVMKKVFVGGDITPSPEGSTPNKIRSLLKSGTTIRKTMDIETTADITACTGKTPSSLCAQWPTVTYSWLSCTGSCSATTVFGSADADDAVSSAQTLPFRFTFYGNTYTQIYISTNGWISFTDPSSLSYASNADMANSAAPNNIIAPYWDDLMICDSSTGGSCTTAIGSSIKTFTSGSSPNRIFVINFDKMIHKDDTGKADPLIFQVLFYEGSNHIVFQYSDVRTTKSFGAGLLATVGVENSSGSSAKKYSYNGSTALTNSKAIFATPHITYKITTSSSKETEFQPAAPLEDDTSSTGNDFFVNIDVLGVSKVSGSCPSGSYYNKDRDSCYDHDTVGLFHEFRDAELSGTLGFRLGFMILSKANTGTDGGDIKNNGKYFNKKETSSLMTSTRGATPTTKAPMSEGLYEAMRYFSQVTAKWGGYDVSSTTCNDSNTDPYCFPSSGKLIECCKSFVILVSSGNYNDDFRSNIYNDTLLTEVATDTRDGEDLNITALTDACKSTSGGSCASTDGTRTNYGWLDNVAYKAHTTDWRTNCTTPGSPAGCIDGFQNLTVYTVNTFGTVGGSGADVLKKAAKYGGFEDKDGDNAYDADKYNLVSGQCVGVDSDGTYGEDDLNCDGLPDTYFEASTGGDIKGKIEDAVAAILKSSASGTSVSVLSTSAGGEGAIYQAYFYPAKVEGTKEERTWPGYLRSFFLDKYQNLRDDAGSTAATLDITSITPDNIVQMCLNTTTNEVWVKRLVDGDGDYTADTTPSSSCSSSFDNAVSLDGVASIWEGGKKLALREKSTRNIYTWVDLDNDGAVDDSSFDNSGEARLFTTTDSSSTLKPYLRAGSTTEADNIINFTRGNAITGYRNRCISISGSTTDESGCTDTDSGTAQRVWALGDIVYSTPTLVSGPGEQYDLIYSDTGYREFRKKYKDRRRMVYVGANDGMLHAFNAGVFDESTVTFTANPLDMTGSSWTSPTLTLGDEVWAFIPHDNLPHLAWLACNETEGDPSVCGTATYTHVFYVDQRPKSTDVKIFNNTGSADCPGGVTGKADGQSDTCHPYGWGTILIMGMRLGGGAIDVDLSSPADSDTADAGEKSFRSAYYVFDITNPEKAPKLLWRFNGVVDADADGIVDVGEDKGLGFTTSYPAIARICTNKTKPCTGTEGWYMVVGSGPKNEAGANNRDYKNNNTTQTGKVFVVDLIDGSLDQTFTMDSNAIMGDASVVDADLDFNSDVIYIGSAISTTSGKIYRINTNATIPTTTAWTGSTLFDPNPTQTDADPDAEKDMGPLLIPPSVAKDSKGNLWVFFGTGRLRSTDDLSNSDQQRFYGIRDGCWKSISGGDACSTAINNAYTISNLYDSSNIVVKTTTGSSQVCYTDACTTTSSFTDLISTVRGNNGWFINLYNYNPTSTTDTTPSERALSRSVVLGGLVLFTAYAPTSDICSVFGDSALYSLYYETGTAYTKSTVGTYSSGGVDYVSKSLSLGKGMPTAVGVAVGEKVVGYVQKSTGEIVRVETEPGFAVKSGPASWKEKAGGGGTIELEEMYKHIVK